MFKEKLIIIPAVTETKLKGFTMRKVFVFLMSCLMALSVFCAVNAAEEHSDTLMVYFSATGTTKSVAEKIADLTGADLYEIIPAEIYTAEDLNWNDRNSRTSIETDDPSCRPEIASDELNLEGYDTIYVGYPIWWGDIPRIMSTFVEKYDFEERTMIPFCTSGGSGVGQSDKHLEEQAGSGKWVKGTRLQAGISNDDLLKWINTDK